MRPHSQNLVSLRERIEEEEEIECPRALHDLGKSEFGEGSRLFSDDGKERKERGRKLSAGL